MTDKTKLGRILIARNMTQLELIDKIMKTTGVKIEAYRMSKIVNGQITNYYTDTCRAIASTLGVNMETILED